jgi:short-subunit dehydrogenase
MRLPGTWFQGELERALLDSVREGGTMGNTGGQKRKEYALITGASSGIGYELAKVFAQNGFSLVLVARSRERLETAAKLLSGEYLVDCRVIPADLSMMSGVEEVHRRVSESNLTVSVLVNDAGVGSYGPFCQTDFRIEAQVINLNILGLTYLTRLFVGEMVNNGSGRILNVASTTGFWPVPHMSVYAATKAYVISFSQALASELKGTGVNVSVLCPGAVDTGFLTGGQKKVRHRRSGLVGRVRDRMMHMDAATVAATAYRDLMKNKRVIVPSAFFRIVVSTMKFVPQGLVSDLRARSHRKTSSDRQ